MNHIEIYRKHLHENYISGSVTDETSCYPDLRNLFDELGKSLKPDDKPQEGQLPAWGAIEVKAPNINLDAIASDVQTKLRNSDQN
jgi:hypothetical protein